MKNIRSTENTNLLIKLIEENPNDTDAYNKWTTDPAIGPQETDIILDTLDFIKGYRNLPQEQKAFLRDLENKIEKDEITIDEKNYGF